MNKEISPLKIILGLSSVLDLAEPQLSMHHKTVAYISLKLSEKMGIEAPLKYELLISALIHDIGMLSWKEIREVKEIEATDPHRHAYLAYLLLKASPIFKKIAPRASDIILYHHAPWRAMENPSLRSALLHSIARVTGVEISLPSYILSLADKVSYLIRPDVFILHQTEDIRQRIRELSGNELPQEVVDAFLELSTKECFWLEMNPPFLEFFFMDISEPIYSLPIETSDYLSLANFICDVVDFHSPFTAVHSQAVSAVAEKLAEFCELSQQELYEIRIAGYLHDLGKLAIPLEILEKNDKLRKDEFSIVKAHPFYTYKALSRVNGWERIRDWASFHHENLDGTGYPFHLTANELDLGSRIMAVADVFSALREYRPYREVMTKLDVLSILRKMAEDGARDGEIISLIEENYDEIDAVFLQTQFSTLQRYQRLWKDVAQLPTPY